LNLEGLLPLQKKQYFEAPDAEKQKEYEKEIRQRYGEQAFIGVKDWNSYSVEQKLQIQAESEAIYRDLATILEGMGDASMQFLSAPPLATLEGEYLEAVQAAQPILVRWHQHLRYFYEPSSELLRGKGQLYCEHPDFRATFTRFHQALPEFLRIAIEAYCERL
jgi:MerR family transcriptional regulator, thiopeptide resistance regulator